MMSMDAQHSENNSSSSLFELFIVLEPMLQNHFLLVVLGSKSDNCGLLLAGLAMLKPGLLNFQFFIPWSARRS